MLEQTKLEQETPSFQHKCITCGVDIQVPPNAKKKKCCSVKCYQESKKEEFKCKICGDIFRQTPWKKQEFCSRACVVKSRTKEKILCKCEECGVDFEKYSYSDKRFCNQSCSAKWRMKQNSIRERVYSKETAEKISKALKDAYKNNPEISINASKRMKINNPMYKKESLEKMRAALKGRTFLSRGGNSKITHQQKILHEFFGSEWFMEYSIKTREVKECFKSLPNCYKVDLANPYSKIVIEVDGKSHLTKKWNFLDKRKTEVLEKLGWKVLRFWNWEVENMNAFEVMNRVYQFTT